MTTTMKLAKVAAALVVVCALCTPAAALATSSDSIVATFDGNQLRLADSWGKATACWSDADGTRCYRTEAEMDAAEAAPRPPRGSIQPLASCSSSLRLYANTSYGGSVLNLSTQATYLNLSSYGFSNVTSSYRVGACNSIFFDGSNGGAPAYPGPTGAYASATSMASGWDNRVSSVYIA